MRLVQVEENIPPGLRSVEEFKKGVKGQSVVIVGLCPKGDISCGISGIANRNPLRKMTAVPTRRALTYLQFLLRPCHRKRRDRYFLHATPWQTLRIPVRQLKHDHAMNKEVFHSDYDGHPETVYTDKELGDYLSAIATEIGWVVIHFNSLEDSIARCLREMMLRDPSQDERLDVFLAEMGYIAKARALTHLYGQAVAHGAACLPTGELVELEKDLNLAATLRNGYAHADWIGLRADAYIKVKTRSSRNGIVHRYRRIDVEAAKADVSYIVSLHDRLDAVHELVLDTIYERRDKDEVAALTLPLIKYPPSADTKKCPDRAYDETREDILNALLSLGYPNEEAAASLKIVPFGVSVIDGIKIALQTLQRATPT